MSVIYLKGSPLNGQIPGEAGTRYDIRGEARVAPSGANWEQITFEATRSL